MTDFDSVEANEVMANAMHVVTSENQRLIDEHRSDTKFKEASIAFALGNLGIIAYSLTDSVDVQSYADISHNIIRHVILGIGIGSYVVSIYNTIDAIKLRTSNKKDW